MINQPYIKQYNEDGEVSNPIVGSYNHLTSSNRRIRRNNPAQRFKGNKKGCSLTVGQKFKYHRVIQQTKETLVQAKKSIEFSVKTIPAHRIEHYLLK